MKKWRWWFWGTLPMCMVVGAFLFGYGHELMGNYVKGFFVIGPLLWLILWLLVALGWMLVHFNDTDGNDHHSGGSTFGVEWEKLGMWYLRGRLRNQMRKLGK